MAILDIMLKLDNFAFDFSKFKEVLICKFPNNMSKNNIFKKKELS